MLKPRSRFCRNMRDMREDLKLNQATFAKELGVPVSTYSSWERGRTSPDITTVIKIADFFDCSIDELVGREPNKSSCLVLADTGAMTEEGLQS